VAQFWIATSAVAALSEQGPSCSQEEKPSRSGAIRRLIEFALAAKSKNAAANSLWQLMPNVHQARQSSYQLASHLTGSLNAPWLFRVRDPYFCC
jgi:hypothetical protein